MYPSRDRKHYRLSRNNLAAGEPSLPDAQGLKENVP